MLFEFWPGTYMNGEVGASGSSAIMAWGGLSLKSRFGGPDVYEIEGYRW